MSASRRSRHIQTLRRRRDHVSSRINERRGHGDDLDFDRAECAALTWALRVLLTARDRGILHDLDKVER